MRATIVTARRGAGVVLFDKIDVCGSKRLLRAMTRDLARAAGYTVRCVTSRGVIESAPGTMSQTAKVPV